MTKPLSEIEADCPICHGISCGFCRGEVKATFSRDRHGMTGTRQHNIWRGMKARCNNKNEPAYKWYGARGIGICARWGRFINFWDDMGGSYREDLTLDRIDNNKGYFKDNCRWATMKEQASNRSNSRFVQYCGEKITISELSRRVGLSLSCIYGRIRSGWDMERIINTPSRVNIKK